MALAELNDWKKGGDRKSKDQEVNSSLAKTGQRSGLATQVLKQANAVKTKGTDDLNAAVGHPLGARMREFALYWPKTRQAP
jgi:hypothetical protein